MRTAKRPVAGTQSLQIFDRIRVNVGIEGAGAPKTALSSAGGESLVADSDRVLKGLKAGPGVMMTADASTVTFSAVSGGAGTTLRNECAPPIAGQSLVGPSSTILDHYFKGVAGGEGISTRTVGSDVVVAQTDTGVTPGLYKRALIAVNAQGRVISAANGSSDDVRLESMGDGASLVVQSAGPGLGIRSVKGGAALTAVQGPTDVILDLSKTSVTPGTYTRAVLTVDAQGRVLSAANGSSTDVKLADSAGVPGASLVAGGVGPSLAVRRVQGGTGLTAVQNPHDVTLKLNDTAVIPGRYIQANIEVDAQGRVIAAESGLSTDVFLEDDAATQGTSLIVDGEGPLLKIRKIGGTNGLATVQTSKAVLLSLTDTAVAPGRYIRANIEVDAQGRLVAAEHGSSTDVVLSDHDAVAPGASLVVGGAGPVLSIRKVNGGIGLRCTENDFDIALHLRDTAVIPGRYVRANLEVDAQGRVVAADNGSSTDVRLSDAAAPGVSLVAGGNGPHLVVRKLVGVSGVTCEQRSNHIEVSQVTSYHRAYHDSTQSVASRALQTVAYTAEKKWKSSAVLAEGMVAPEISGDYQIVFSCKARMSAAATGTFLMRTMVGGVQIAEEPYLFEVSAFSIADRSVPSAVYVEPIEAGQVVIVQILNNMSQQLVISQAALTVTLLRQL